MWKIMSYSYYWLHVGKISLMTVSVVLKTFNWLTMTHSECSISADLATNPNWNFYNLKCLLLRAKEGEECDIRCKNSSHFFCRIIYQFMQMLVRKVINALMLLPDHMLLQIFVFLMVDGGLQILQSVICWRFIVEVSGRKKSIERKKSRGHGRRNIYSCFKKIFSYTMFGLWKWILQLIIG